MKLNNHSLLLLASAFALASCVKEEYNIDKISSSVDVNSSVAIPIAGGTITLEKVLPKDSDPTNYIYIDKDNLLHIVYKQTLDSLTFGSYANVVKDFQSSTSISAPNGLAFPSNIEVKGNLTYNLGIALEHPDQSIEEALVESGMLRFANSSSFASGSFSYTIESPDILRADKSNLKVTFNPTSANPGTNISLAGCTFKPTNGNQIRFNVSYSITKYGTSLNDKVTLSFGISSVKIKQLTGNIGKINIALQNNALPLEINNNTLNTGDFDIKNPLIKLKFRNQAGIPFAFTHTGVTAARDNETYIITGLPTPINILSPAIGVESEKNSEATIDPNSNIVSVLGKFPKELRFNGNLTTNPSTIPSTKNVIRATDKLYIGAEADLPLDIRLANVTLTDTTTYNFSNLVSDSKSVEKMKLETSFINGMPIDLEVNAFIIDKDGKVLDSMFSTPFLLKAAATQNGIVVTPTSSKTEVVYDQSRIQKLKTGDRIIFATKASTYGNATGQTVKILANYKLDIKVVGFIQANLNNL